MHSVCVFCVVCVRNIQFFTHALGAVDGLTRDTLTLSAMTLLRQHEFLDQVNCQFRHLCFAGGDVFSSVDGCIYRVLDRVNELPSWEWRGEMQLYGHAG